MWHDDVMNCIEKGHDDAYEWSRDECLPGDADTFEILYKNGIRETLLRVRDMLLEDALNKFSKER